MKDLDPKKCQFDGVLDRTMRFPRPHQCSRKPVKDGFCRQHHPDAVKIREEQSRALDQQRWENSPFMKLRRAYEEIERLKKQHKKDVRYALTTQLLHLRHELFHRGGISRLVFDRQYLAGLGRYERNVAKKEGIELDP